MIIFYFEQRGYGGVASLIINFIHHLDILKCEVKLFNYENDVIDLALKKLGADNYELIDIEKTPPADYVKYVSYNDVLVVTGFYLSLQLFFRINPRLFFYNVFPDSLIQTGIYSKNFVSKAINRQIIKRLMMEKSLSFMDDTGIKTIHEILGLNIDNHQYFPVCVDVPSINSFLNRQNKTTENVIRISYVGRSVSWKNNSIKKILDDIKQLKLEYSIIINVVVDNKADFEDFIQRRNYISENLELNIYENIPLSELESFLINNSDLHFGMGTSALDGAKMGIPTVLIDFSHKSFPIDYGYKWLNETKNYCLGNDIEANYFVNDGKYQMHEILKMCLNKDTQHLLSNRCYTYVALEHNIKKNVQRLIEITNKTSFHLRTAKFYIPYYMWGYQKFKNIYNSLKNI